MKRFATFLFFMATGGMFACLGGNAAEAGPSLAQQRSIRDNLMLITAARDFYLKINGRLPASFDELVGPEGTLKELGSISGETYHALDLSSRLFSVSASNGTVVSLHSDVPGTMKGPPSSALIAKCAWQAELSHYLKARPTSSLPRIPSQVQASAVKDGLEFVAVLNFQNATFFVLTDWSTGSSQWLKAGEHFGPYSIKQYQEKEELLTLQDQETTVTLKLRDAKVTQAYAVQPEMAYLAIAEIEKREGWQLSTLDIQKPQISGGNWHVYVRQLLECDEWHVLLGESRLVILTPQGEVKAYMKIDLPNKSSKASPSDITNH